MAPAKLQPALLGGVTIGVLSALPVINLANCCCAWVLFGGALAAYLMQQNHPEPIMIGDGRDRRTAVGHRRRVRVADRVDSHRDGHGALSEPHGAGNAA